MAVQLWETLKEAIVAYTGFSPSTFFTVLALLFAAYYVVTGLFGSSDDHHHRHRHAQEEEMPPLRPPVQLGEITAEELKAYDGTDPEKPLLMAIKAQIYDVSQSRFTVSQNPPLCSKLHFVFILIVYAHFRFWVFYLFICFVNSQCLPFLVGVFLGYPSCFWFISSVLFFFIFFPICAISGALLC